MDVLLRIDWQRLFTPEMSMLEIFVRGTIIYLSLCLLLRVVLKRQAGKVSLSDLLVVAVVAGVCENPLIRDTYSITDGVLMVATVLGWGFALDWLSYHVPAIHKLLHSPPVPLIRDGQVLKESLAQELMTEGQLSCKLRQKGVRGPDEVAEAWMEGDGHVSVIKKQASLEQGPRTTEQGSEEAVHRNGSSNSAREGANASVEIASSVDGDVELFLQAARKLEARIDERRQAIAEHERGIAEIQEALARSGFLGKRTSIARTSRSHRATSNGEHPERE